MTRRDVLVTGAGVLGLAALGVGGGIGLKQVFPQQVVYDSPESVAAQVDGLEPTPPCGTQPATDSYEEGPFYDPTSPERSDFRLSGHGGRSLVLQGRVLTTDCQPVPNAVIDMWQVDENGLYDNVGFNYRGHQFSRADGSYALLTVMPIPYFFSGLWRAKHIHVKVQEPTLGHLTTQVFFPDDPEGNARHAGFNDRLLCDLRDEPDGSARAVFNFVLAKR